MAVDVSVVGVIAIGIAAYLGVKWLLADKAVDGASGNAASDEPVVRPYPSARDNPRYKPDRHQSLTSLSAKTKNTELDLSADCLPEDSTLKRHYLQNLQAIRLAVSHPYPTDFNLKRHYDTEIRHKFGLTAATGLSAESGNKPEVSQAKTPKAKSVKAKPKSSSVKPKAPSATKSSTKTQDKPKAAPKPRKPKASSNLKSQ